MKRRTPWLRKQVSLTQRSQLVQQNWTGPHPMFLPSGCSQRGLDPGPPQLCTSAVEVHKVCHQRAGHGDRTDCGRPTGSDTATGSDGRMTVGLG